MGATESLWFAVDYSFARDLLISFNPLFITPFLPSAPIVVEIP